MTQSIIGFTGTRDGMTPRQKWMVVQVLLQYMPVEAHHGDCLGSDTEFHHLVRGLVSHCKIVVHPGFQEGHPVRAMNRADLVLPVKPPLDRNHDIVDACHFMLSTPKEGFEVQRSGTWATIRYARKTHKAIFVYSPNE